MVGADRVRLRPAPGPGEGREGVLHGAWTQNSDLTETHKQGRGRHAIDMFQTDDLVVGDPVPIGADFLAKTLTGNQERAGEAFHRPLEVDRRVAGGADDPVRELVGQREALALDIDPAGYHDGLGDDLPAAQSVAREPVDALREIRFHHLDALVFEQLAQAGNRVAAEIPDTAEFIGPLVDLGFARDAVTAPPLHPVDARLDVEDVLDRQIALQAVHHDRFSPCVIASRSAGTLAELNRVERLDLRAHQEVQRDVESLPETDQYSRGGQHLARLVLADRLSGHFRAHRVRERPHR